MLSRRSLLSGVSYSLAGHMVWNSAVAQTQPAAPASATSESDPGPRFSFDWLTERVRQRAAEPFRPAAVQLPDVLGKLTYDRYRAIAFRPERALWAHGDSAFTLHAFHMGWLFNEPVQIFEVVDGLASPVAFSDADFEYRPPLDAEDFRDLVMPGVAGFRLHHPLNRPDVYDEIAVFQGASYFRALGRRSAYGLSARGAAVNTAAAVPEEFPRFNEFYLARPAPGDQSIVIHAAMDSRSLTGALRFRIAPGEDTVTDVLMRLFFRTDIERLGIAPMTSMFLFGASNRSTFDDYRGEVHDSEGLRIVRANGEVLWRCLNNPSALANSVFAEQAPASFGLLQRNRDFAKYQDAEARYERRPSLKVEPLSDWGRGAIELVEIPSDLEKDDNIVAFWSPEEPPKAGQSLEMEYRLTWGDLRSEADGALARAIATRSGIGGPSGVRNEVGLRKFVVDFQGGLIAGLPAESDVVAVTNVVGGEVVSVSVHKVESGGVWRLAFDVRPAGDGPLELVAYLAVADQPASETWLYQWRPGDEKRRV
jgi:glucans biosynthesis protein